VTGSAEDRVDGGEARPDDVIFHLRGVRYV